jgi:putative flavoprotein involved in K+ transport
MTACGCSRYYPARDEVVTYLRQYARHFQLPIVTSAYVERVERTDAGFRVITADGTVYQARGLIAATGAFHRPYMPQLPGQEDFTGQVLHAAAYRHLTPFVGQRVVVVGAGNSAIQIGVELARVAHVSLATRAPIQFRRQHIFGRDIHHWAWLLGLDRLPLGPGVAQVASTGVLDTGVYQAAVAAGQPERRPMFTHFTTTGVVWDDDTEEPVDAVIYATGYRPNLNYLAALGALDADAQPLHRRGVSTVVPNLVYVGLSNQWTYASATLRGVGPDAAYVVRHLRERLRAVGPPQVRTHVVRRLLGGWRCCAGKEGAL